MLHFGKIPKKMVKFDENSAKFGEIWANLRNFGRKQETNQKFAENSEFCEKNSLLLVNYSLHSLVSPLERPATAQKGERPKACSAEAGTPGVNSSA